MTSSSTILLMYSRVAAYRPRVYTAISRCLHLAGGRLTRVSGVTSTDVIGGAFNHRPISDEHLLLRILEPRRLAGWASSTSEGLQSSAASCLRTPSSVAALPYRRVQYQRLWSPTPSTSWLRESIGRLYVFARACPWWLFVSLLCSILLTDVIICSL